MKRREIFLAVLGIVLIVWGAAWIRAGRGSMRDVTLDGGPACPAAPVRVLEPSGAPRGSVLIFHGLSANRIVMLTNGQQFAAAGFRVFLPDGPGHGDDTAPYSFAAYESCARGILSTLERRGEISPRNTVLLGHSLGGALVVRLADDFPVAATIAVSTAPLVFPRGIPANLLLVAPQFDMPPVRGTESRLAAAAGAARTAPADFRERRAFRLLPIPWRSHTSVLFDRSAARAMVRWALDAVGATAARAPDPDVRAFEGDWLGLLGILLLFPAAATAATRGAGIRQRPTHGTGTPSVLSVFFWTALLIPSAIIAARWTLLSLLRLYGAEYLATVLLLTGAPLAVGYGNFAARQERGDASRRPDSRSPNARPLSAAIAGAGVALLVILAVGAWLNLQITEVWPVAARWARFPFVGLALFPICYAEECALGDPANHGQVARYRRMALFVTLRGIIWLVMLCAWLSGVAGALLPTIFVVFLGVLALGQRLGADALRRRTGSASAAALFNAILGAWFVAAAFPLA